jgi:hypothetical protein
MRGVQGVYQGFFGTLVVLRTSQNYFVENPTFEIGSFGGKENPCGRLNFCVFFLRKCFVRSFVWTLARKNHGTAVEAF